MAPAAGFAQVLEQFVDQYGSGEPAVAGRLYGRHPGIATRPLLWLEGSALEPRRAVSRHSRAAATADAEPRRPRVLSREQRAALDRFVALGAHLLPSYTRRELRSAFRSLARTFHPDHHPAISASEKARLSLMFNDVRNAYDVLKNITWGA
jgi:hypothetical protein